MKKNFNELKKHICLNLSDEGWIAKGIGYAGNPFKCLELCYNDKTCTAATY